MFEMNNFEAIGINLASPEKILEWSRGEVKKPETINYRTLKPERDGLFCEKIFGPTKDWECHCGKYKKIRYKGIVCDRCGVEVTKSKVRRERLGHIKLAAPVSHIWYFRGIPSRMGLILDMSPRVLEKVLYFASYIVVDPKDSNLTYKQILSEREYRDAVDTYGRKGFVAKMGAEAIKMILQAIDIDKMAAELREEFRSSTGQKRVRIIKRLEVVEAFKKSGNKPEWMVLDVIPVLPPELRPMVQLDGGRFATSDLNDLYRRVINRNSRLLKLLSLSAPEIIVRNEKRMLQEAVDALIDNGRRGRAVTGPGNRALKSLSDLLKGKQGRFRQNLLGKRVDYSGRSVIVVGPELKIHQCGLPKEMALELFKPFVMKRVVKDGLAHNIKTAKKLVDRATDEVWDILDDVIKDHPVLLNRAPTLHRLGIQAFEPVLVEGRAIKLHPLVCTAYNADFDGDQMAVHVPLSAEAQAEARFLMLSANNLLKPQDGKPVTVPTQDMVIGCYYMTIDKPGAKGEGKVFSSVDEAVMAWDEHEIDLHAKIKVRVTVDHDGEKLTGITESTLGRLVFNQVIPQNLGYVDRSVPENLLKLECDFLVGKKELGSIIERCIRTQGVSQTAVILDEIKSMGFRYSTKGGISISIYDMIVPEVKKTYITEAEATVDAITRKYNRGLLNEDGRYTAVVDVWRKTTDNITTALKDNLGPFNPVYMMSQSGARGNINQIKQLAGMRGNMSDTSGKTIEIPIKSNLREGMNVLEFFISSHGARKALSDTALKTADSGYLTRRLVDVSQDVIVREEDCGTEEGIYVSEITSGGSGKRIVKTLHDRITGRYAAEDILDPQSGEIIVKSNEIIDDDLAVRIEKSGTKQIKIRSVLTCRARYGVCSKCYGLNLATNEPANIGEAVGIMAAQSIGEPGTQLTMRTFHTGGIASGDDITQGLPRVEELFEARKPKGQAILAEIDGVIRMEETSKRRRDIVITPPADSEEVAKTYPVPYGSQLIVKDGDYVNKGDLLTEGSVNPHEIMKLKGVRAVQNYIIGEVVKVYKNNGVEINDKHIEIITRQMLRKYRVDDPGDTELMTGTLVDMFDYEEANEKAAHDGTIESTGKSVLLGITKASLATDSFLSAASFQETTRVLTDAAVKGKVDPLVGLKENVIIGKLIPAGTGMNKYRNITSVPDCKENAELFGTAIH
ncbi:MAG: DNA-directed RNA polymerase subunit beta' [Saccharofermentanales bacterium]